MICEIMNEDGTMARVPQLDEFCARHGLKMISVAELIRYRLKHERFVRRVRRRLHPDRIRRIPHHRVRQRSQPGNARGAGPRRGGRAGKRAGSHAFALHVSATSSVPPVAIAHGWCADSLQQDRGGGLRRAGLSARDRSRLPHRARGPWRARDGVPRPRFHALQGEAGQRQLQHEHGIGAQILSDLGLHTIRLLTNHPRKIVALEGFGIEIVEQVPVTVAGVKTG